jgi:hypothetical protein
MLRLLFRHHPEAGRKGLRPFRKSSCARPEQAHRRTRTGESARPHTGHPRRFSRVGEPVATGKNLGQAFLYRSALTFLPLADEGSFDFWQGVGAMSLGVHRPSRPLAVLTRPLGGLSSGQAVVRRAPSGVSVQRSVLRGIREMRCAGGNPTGVPVCTLSPLLCLPCLVWKRLAPCRRFPRLQREPPLGFVGLRRVRSGFASGQSSLHRPFQIRRRCTISCCKRQHFVRAGTGGCPPPALVRPIRQGSVGWRPRKFGTCDSSARSGQGRSSKRIPGRTGLGLPQHGRGWTLLLEQGREEVDGGCTGCRWVLTGIRERGVPG